MYTREIYFSIDDKAHVLYVLASEGSRITVGKKEHRMVL